MSTLLSGLITAEWRDLVMVSYDIDPVLLVPFVPRGTSLDFHRDRALVTVVGLRVLNSRVAGVPLPFHQDLEQVNFRFYVWRREGRDVRRGVVFLKEIVPSVVMTLGARLFFSEKFEAAPMRHRVAHAQPASAAYEWQTGPKWNRLSARYGGRSRQPDPESVEAFIKERTWGYSRQSDGSTLEYCVEHPSWEIWDATDAVVDCDVPSSFGRQFAGTLGRPPVSAFVAAGSEASVHAGRVVE